MADACEEHYLRLLGDCGNVLNASFQDNRSNQMSSAHAFVADLSTWIAELKSRPEGVVIEAASREYQFALLALTLGQYRAAYAALRLCLELSLSAVSWSANEVELREWKRAERDSSWTRLMCTDNGVLSKRFVRLFAPSLEDECARYVAMAAKVYRECSEHVHGNAHTHDMLPRAIAFDGVTFSDWHQKANVVSLVVSFALAMRYLLDLTPDAKGRIEPTVSAHLGHLPSIRAML